MSIKTFIPWLVQDLHLPSLVALLLTILLILFLTKLLQSVLWRLIEGLYHKKTRIKAGNAREKTILTVFHSVLSVGLYFYAGVSILDLLGVHTGSILAAAGIGGIALAFGAQRIIADLFSGVFLLLDNDLNIGDWVEFEGKEGEIISLTLRRTKLRQYSGVIITLPNSKIITIVNYRRTRQAIQCDIVLSVSNHLPLEAAKRILMEAAASCQKAYPSLLEKDPYWVGVDQTGPFSYEARIGLVSRYGDHYALQRRMREACLQALQDNQGLAQGMPFSEEGRA